MQAPDSDRYPVQCMRKWLTFVTVLFTQLLGCKIFDRKPGPVWFLILRSEFLVAKQTLVGAFYWHVQYAKMCWESGVPRREGLRYNDKWRLLNRESAGCCLRKEYLQTQRTGSPLLIDSNLDAVRLDLSTNDSIGPAFVQAECRRLRDILTTVSGILEQDGHIEVWGV